MNATPDNNTATDPAPGFLRDLPVVLTLDHMAIVCGKAVVTIRRLVQRGTFDPPPFARSPYRWMRDDVEDHLRRLRDDALQSHAKRRAATVTNSDRAVPLPRRPRRRRRGPAPAQ